MAHIDEQPEQVKDEIRRDRARLDPTLTFLMATGGLAALGGLVFVLAFMYAA